MTLFTATTAVSTVNAEPAEALRRLRGDLSLDGVARNKFEVGSDDVAGLTRPITQRIPIQAKTHPDPVVVHPDLSVTLGAAVDSYTVGFALGTPARLQEVTEATHRLRKGYQPIVESCWKAGGLVFERVIFSVLPDDDAVTTGMEKQNIVMRASVTNSADVPLTSALVVLVGRANGIQNKDCGYCPFTAPAARWQQNDLKVEMAPGLLLVGGQVLLAFHSDPATPVSLHAEIDAVQGSSGEAIHLNHGLRFELQLQPNECRTIAFVMAGSSRLYPRTERERLASLNFDQALARAEAYWERILQPGMKLTTPEPKLNDIYRHLVLSCLTNLRKGPNNTWVYPIHHCLAPEWIWPWEFAQVSASLDSLGYQRDMEACLQYFVEHQSGVGSHGKDIGPDGEVTSRRGCFVGTTARWMCETGSVLSMMANHYRYARDTEWLKTNRPSILAAWDWIQQQRDTTRTNDTDGTPVAHYGLLPKGRVSDWDGHRYHYCYSDGYTYKGMADIAVAFREAGLPEAARLAKDVDEYRQCIVRTLHRAEFTDPDTGLFFVPNTVYFRQNERGGVWIGDGPRALFDVGILDPVRDAKYWDSMLAMLQRNWGTLGGLMGHFQGALQEDQSRVATDSPYWYCNGAEMNYQRDFLARGEYEKALLVFYSNLVYGMSADLFQTVERLNITDGNYAPWQPNSSGNARVLAMMRRMVIDEQDEGQGVLWLLRGCPRRWFAPGESVVVEDAPTLFGKMTMRTTGGNGTIEIDIDPPMDRRLKQLQIAARHPNRQKARSVTVNGKPTEIDNEMVTLPTPSAPLHIVIKYAP